MGISKTNILLVEGMDDLVSVVQLMSHRIGWPLRKEEAPVYIENCDGADNLLDPIFLSATLKSSSLKILGILVDADEDGVSRWDSLRASLLHAFPDLPTSLPQDGLIATDSTGRSVGVWLMPDNLQNGSLETFLKLLVPIEKQPLLEYAESSVAVAKEKGASYRDAHLDKALLYTWLAWQDPPGQLCGRAITQKILDAASPGADQFVSWFRRLYAL